MLDHPQGQGQVLGPATLIDLMSRAVRLHNSQALRPSLLPSAARRYPAGSLGGQPEMAPFAQSPNFTKGESPKTTTHKRGLLQLTARPFLQLLAATMSPEEPKSCSGPASRPPGLESGTNGTRGCSSCTSERSCMQRSRIGQHLPPEVFLAGPLSASPQETNALLDALGQGAPKESFGHTSPLGASEARVRCGDTGCLRQATSALASQARHCARDRSLLN
jgi:hypothetical protein